MKVFFWPSVMNFQILETRTEDEACNNINNCTEETLTLLPSKGDCPCPDLFEVSPSPCSELNEHHCWEVMLIAQQQIHFDFQDHDCRIG